MSQNLLGSDWEIKPSSAPPPYDNGPQLQDTPSHQGYQPLSSPQIMMAPAPAVTPIVINNVQNAGGGGGCCRHCNGPIKFVTSRKTTGCGWCWCVLLCFTPPLCFLPLCCDCCGCRETKTVAKCSSCGKRA